MRFGPPRRRRPRCSFSRTHAWRRSATAPRTSTTRPTFVEQLMKPLPHGTKLSRRSSSARRGRTTSSRARGCARVRCYARATSATASRWRCCASPTTTSPPQTSAWRWKRRAVSWTSRRRIARMPWRGAWRLSTVCRRRRPGGWWRLPSCSMRGHLRRGQRRSSSSSRRGSRRWPGRSCARGTRAPSQRCAGRRGAACSPSTTCGARRRCSPLGKMVSSTRSAQDGFGCTRFPQSTSCRSPTQGPARSCSPPPQRVEQHWWIRYSQPASARLRPTLTPTPRSTSPPRPAKPLHATRCSKLLSRTVRVPCRQWQRCPTGMAGARISSGAVRATVRRGVPLCPPVLTSMWWPHQKRRRRALLATLWAQHPSC